jgi:hypothetical protein
MRLFHVSLPICFVTGLLMAAPTMAAVDVPAVSNAPAGKDSVRRGVQAPAGMLHARVLLHVNASKDLFGKPVSLAPDLFYAISDTLQIGLLHNGPMGFQTRPGAGLCLTGKSNGCPHVYDNVGLDLLYGLVFGDFNLSAHSSLYVARISDPTAVMLTLGTAGKFHFSDNVGLFFDPQIGIALTDRDGINKDMLFVPLELQFQLGAATALKLLTGVTGQLSSLGDTYQAPLGLGLIQNLNTSVDLGIRFSFDNLLGKTPAGVSRADTRSIALLLHVRS